MTEPAWRARRTTSAAEFGHVQIENRKVGFQREDHFNGALAIGTFTYDRHFRAFLLEFRRDSFAHNRVIVGQHHGYCFWFFHSAHSSVKGTATVIVVPPGPLFM